MVDRRAEAGYAASWTTEGTSGEKTVIEAQWLKGADPQRLLVSLGKRASDRKLRLFRCACCRREWHLAKTSRLQQVLPLVEGFADGTTKDRDRLRQQPELGHAFAVFHPAVELAG